MSFSADWLATRHAADARARNAEIAGKLQKYFAGKSGVQVLDLGCGTGANLAMTSRLLPKLQHWTMVDNDPDLLSRITAQPGVSHETVTADLASNLEGLFYHPFDLVTASALFDLAGATLIDTLVQQTVKASAAFFTVLTYDGTEHWAPGHPHDAAVLSAFHADQHSDKGLGAALGPDATDYLAIAFRKAGYRVHSGQSDWALTQANDAALINMLAKGIRDATAPKLGSLAEEWYESRRAAETVRIGHQDLIALPDVV